MNVDLLEPLQFAFFRHGLLVGTMAGALCGLVGVYVVLRGMSYIGHGLSHAIFGGAAASSVLSLNYYLGAGLWGILSALAVTSVSRRQVRSDAAIGVVTTASFALGLALFGLFGTAQKSADAVLFGSILGVTTADVWIVAITGALVAAVVALCYRPLLFATFDPDVASASGLRVARLDALLMIVLAATVLVTMKVIGVLLVAALVVIPPATARLLTHRFSTMLAISTAIGAVSAAIGMYGAYFFDISAGAAVVLVATAAFLGAYARRLLNDHRQVVLAR